MGLKCVRCGAELEEGYRKAHCPNCISAWVERQKQWAKSQGMEILDVVPKDYVSEEENAIQDGWPVPIVRMKDYMKPEEINDDGAMKLTEAIFDGAIDNITKAYEAWFRAGLENARAEVIYRAEGSYNQATRILCSPLFSAISSSDPNDLLEAIWKDVNHKVCLGSAKLEALVKKRMRHAREVMTKPKESKGRAAK